MASIIIFVVCFFGASICVCRVASVTSRLEKITTLTAQLVCHELSPLSKQFRAYIDEGILHEECDLGLRSYELSSIDETKAEGPHRDVKRLLDKAPHTEVPYLNARLRLPQNLQLHENWLASLECVFVFASLRTRGQDHMWGRYMKPFHNCVCMWSFVSNGT